MTSLIALPLEHFIAMFPAFTTNSGGSKLGKPWPRSTQESPSILELRGMEWVIMVIVTLVLSGTSMSCGKSTGCVFCQDVGLPGLPDSYQFFSFPAPLSPRCVFDAVQMDQAASGHGDCSTKGQYILVNGSKQLADVRDREIHISHQLTTALGF